MHELSFRANMDDVKEKLINEVQKSHRSNGYGKFQHVTEDMITSPNNIERFVKLFYYRNELMKYIFDSF